MKRIFCVMLAAIMLLSIFTVGASAADAENMTFAFDLSVNGKQNVTASTGDIITVALWLKRTDANETWTMRGVQAKLNYDKEFFEVVPNSLSFMQELITTYDVSTSDPRYYRLKVGNYSASGGTLWKDEVLMGTFMLKVKATSGVAVITNLDTSVTNPQFVTGGYTHTTNSVTVKITDDCIVKFDTMGGSPQLPDKVVKYGSKLERFDHPTKEGYYFAGWYKDINCKQPWDFDKDVVDRNMTLYAKWATEPVLPTEFTVTFESNGGSKVESVIAKYGEKIAHVDHPTKKGYYFAGWYKDEALTQMWDFNKDVVRSDMTLYAKWSKTPVRLPCQDNGGWPWGWLVLILVFLLIFVIIFLIVFFTKKITFESNGGTPVKSQRAFRKRKLRRPIPPTKEGYTFVGWAKDEDCTIPWRFNYDEVEESMTLYAKWRPENK